MDLFDKVSRKVQEVAQHHANQSPGSSSFTSQSPGHPTDRDQGGSHFRQNLPDFVFQAVDKYVDGFAPHISPIITKEINAFQTQTVDSLEFHLKEAFRAVFSGDFSAFRKVGDLDQLFVAQGRSGNGPSLPQPPNAYGQRGLPFAPSSPDMGLNSSGTQERGLSGGQVLMSALAAGFDNGPNNIGSSNDEGAQRERNLFQDALGKVSEFARNEAGKGGGGEFGQFMGKMAVEIDKVKADPDEMARRIIPELKNKVTELLTKHHASLAEQMTTAALSQLKKWLRGNTSARELGEGAKGDIADTMKGIFDNFTKTPPASSPYGAQGTARDGGGPEGGAGAETSHGIAGILSKKLSKGLSHVRSSTRDDFRRMLSAIEQTLFNELPESIRGPLAKVFGGDPFDPNLPPSSQRSISSSGRDFFDELGDKFKRIVSKVQQGLRDRVLEVVSGGHRRLESLAWVRVQETVVAKVRKHVPGVKVDIEQEDEVVISGAGQTYPQSQPPAAYQQPPLGGGGSQGGQTYQSQPPAQPPFGGGGFQGGQAYQSQPPAAYQHPPYGGGGMHGGQAYQSQPPPSTYQGQPFGGGGGYQGGQNYQSQPPPPMYHGQVPPPPNQGQASEYYHS